jgi:exosortase/archaeosortase family protein
MTGKLFEKGSPARFLAIFLPSFLAFYYFNILFFGLTSEGNYYNSFIAAHFDYITLLRYLLLHTTAKVLHWLGYASVTNETAILVAGHGTLKLIYSCLGLGVISFFAAFVIAFPKKLGRKLIFLISGVVVIEILNVFRFVILAIFWDKNEDTQIVDHHTLFNIFIYIVIAITLYFWVKHDEKAPTANAKN